MFSRRFNKAVGSIYSTKEKGSTAKVLPFFMPFHKRKMDAWKNYYRRSFLSPARWRGEPIHDEWTYNAGTNALFTAYSFTGGG